MTNILEYLEYSASIKPTKLAVQDQNESCSFQELMNRSQRIGTALAFVQAPKKPVVVLMEKSVQALTSFMGIVYAGCFYIFISPEQAVSRIKHIFQITNASCLITQSQYTALIRSTEFHGTVLYYEDMVATQINQERLTGIRQQAQDIDPLYCNFTSGSTGVPKGVLISHRSMIDFMNYFPSMFQITDEDILANQAPFDFDVSAKDIYTTLKVGATLVIIPKKSFSIITQLMDDLCKHKVTTLIWAVSALCLVTQLKGFTYKVPSHINKVLFSGEVMPIKHLKTLQTYLPNATYVNLYGPTEITCNCTYYRITREFEPNETIPIGRPFPNEKVFLLDENNREIVTEKTIGELCVSGTALALGYYQNPKQTNKAFVQNPLNLSYHEPIYRTGDLAFYNEDGELCFAGRKDFQIKYMGHRIELEEIELTISKCTSVERVCCVFDSHKNKITAFYAGSIEPAQLKKELKAHLPIYMVPAACHVLKELPVTANGKIDRSKLLSLCGDKHG